MVILKGINIDALCDKLTIKKDVRKTFAEKRFQSSLISSAPFIMTNRRESLSKSLKTQYKSCYEYHFS